MLLKMMLLKKLFNDKLVAKVNNIDTIDFVLKTKYQADKTELEKIIPNVTDFVKKNKTHWIRKKIPDIGSLGTKIALTAVESLNRKITANKTKSLLVENELNK